MATRKKIDEEILAVLSENDEVRYKDLKEKIVSLGFKELNLINKQC